MSAVREAVVSFHSTGHDEVVWHSRASAACSSRGGASTPPDALKPVPTGSESHSSKHRVSTPRRACDSPLSSRVSNLPHSGLYECRLSALVTPVQISRGLWCSDPHHALPKTYNLYHTPLL